MLVESIMSGDDNALKLAENMFDDIAIGTGTILKDSFCCQSAGL